MFIQTEPTPNPATLKFLPGRAVLSSGTLDMRDRAAAAQSPLAARLFEIDGIGGVFLGADYPVRDVEVKLTGRWSSYAHFHRWHRTQRISPRADGVVVHLRARVCPELKAWILGFGEDAEVLAPGELRDEIAQRLKEAARRYARPKTLPLAKPGAAKGAKKAAR